MQLASRCMPSGDGAVFTTDADSLPPPHWIASYSALIHAGYDAVAGLARLLPEDMADIPRSLLQRRMSEERYEACLDALEAWLDPVAHNPWPRHYQASGANLAISVAAMRRVSDLCWPACGEDKWLVRSLEAHDGRVRHDTTLAGADLRTLVRSGARRHGRYDAQADTGSRVALRRTSGDAGSRLFPRTYPPAVARTPRGASSQRTSGNALRARSTRPAPACRSLGSEPIRGCLARYRKRVAAPRQAADQAIAVRRRSARVAKRCWHDCGFLPRSTPTFPP